MVPRHHMVALRRDNAPSLGEEKMTSLTRRRALQTGAAAAAVAASPRFALAAGPVVKLRILETTDLHVNVFPYDYYRDAADDTVGLTRTAALVKRRAQGGQEQPPVRQRRPHPGLADGRLHRLSQRA